MKTDAYITKIIQDTGLTRSEIHNKVEEKKSELKGLISDEGALFLIAKEFGVDVSSENTDLIKDIEINISDISLNMKNITLIGRIKEIYSVYEFNKENQEKGYVGSFLLYDTTGEIRIVLWDDHVNMFTNENFKKNELVKILNGYTKESRYGIELHLGRLGKIVLSPDDIDYKKYPKVKNEFLEINKINDKLKSISTEGKVLRKFPTKNFTKNSGEIGSVESIILMDSTGTIRVTFWNEDITKINDFEQGDYVSITNLRPRANNKEPNLIDLHATRNTNVLKKEKKLKLEIELSNSIKELQNKENLVSFKGIITSIDNMKKVTLKSGDEVYLVTFIVSDNTDFIRVTAWREKAESLSKKLSNDTGVMIKNALLKYNNFSGKKEASIIEETNLEIINLTLSNLKKFEGISESRNISHSNNITKISDINTSGIFEIKGLIAKEINRINIYNACSRCLRKIENCNCEEKGEIKPRMILNLLIDDESGVMRSSFIGDIAEKLLGKETEIIMKVMDTPDYDKILEKLSSQLVGRDIYIKGKVKFSDYSNAYELNAFDFQEVDVDYDLEQIIKEI
ncbi:MAG: DUF2240 family protein [Promethearchaeota archaeon]